MNDILQICVHICILYSLLPHWAADLTADLLMAICKELSAYKQSN